MNDAHWKIDDLPWDQFDPAKVNGDILPIIKAASVVEANANDYARYLCNVFPDDPSMHAAMMQWAAEEVQHGAALGRWAERADPAFDFAAARARYTAGFRVDVDAHESVRGSRAGELISRCIVETGTSSYYTALGDAAEEPVLRAICRHIAADELRHYKMFYTYLKDYLDRDRLNRLARLRIGLGRIGESEDDELAYAYYAANAPAEAAFDRTKYAHAYAARAYRFYQRHHVDRVVAMVFKACGLKPNTAWHGVASTVAWQLLQVRKRRALQRVA